MTSQPEQVLENNLIKQLQDLGHQFVTIKDEKGLYANLKSQLEKHNKTTFSDTEFNKILIHLSKGNIFDKAKTLRDSYGLKRDDNTTSYVQFVNQDFWCQNEFQVSNQITITGKRETRYDVTILINGLPLVQIELKRRGIELKEAFNQINRYHKESYSAANGLFQYVQVFVISNGVNTKYYANNPKQSFKQTFFWSDENNKNITQLEQFATRFLDPCHIAKIITKYIVLHESDSIPMVMRPYQYYAVEQIIERVKNSTKNGYVWHTTGSGKTLTSFKASQILTNNPKVHKVVFVVDRQDLDDQTVKEFNAFKKDSIDGTDNTKMLVEQFLDDTPLIVTTIQKLNTAISKARFNDKMKQLQDKKIVFIFDECHRSQFGDTHQKITQFFRNHQMFGFTGTPIFAENAVSKESKKHTTTMLFHDCLHKYVITDAIRDENVLKFSIEYIGRYKKNENSKTNIDIEVEAIDTRELMEAPKRLEAITDYIINNHSRKTHNRSHTAMFCVSSVDQLIQYYELFKRKKEQGNHKLNIATIFTFAANEDESEVTGNIEEPEFDIAAEPTIPYGMAVMRRDKLEEYINDFNATFKTGHSLKDGETFLNYKKDISKKVKEKKIDILLVVNMFLTGFDSKSLNTLYVDKNLKYHGLIQAYSRTNRILDEKKSQGNVVVFRNLKKATDDAVALFSNKNALETIIIKPYEEYLKMFNKAYKTLMAIAPTVDSVNDLESEEEELNFAKAFREIIRLKNVLASFSDFTFEDTYMNGQEFDDYKGKYLDLYQKIKSDTQKESVSVIDEIDFELELIHRDEINVTYILKLLANLKNATGSDREKKKKEIVDALAGETQLRSKKELIEKFIQENLPLIQDEDNIQKEFNSFWDIETKKALEDLCVEEKLDKEKVETIISDYLFTERKPNEEEVIDALEKQPSILHRDTIGKRITNRIVDFVKTFIDGIN
ncbi:MAG: type I restriction endonuclease subunit R [Flavobacterium sp.]